MAKRHPTRGDNLRRALAQEAARIMAEHGIRDFLVAKRKAAERFGVTDGGAVLPKNSEIEEALAELGPRTAEPTPETGEFPRYVIGSPERVRTQLIDMGSQLGVDEMMAVTIVHDHRARLRSYELLAAAFDLPRRP